MIWVWRVLFTTFWFGGCMWLAYKLGNGTASRLDMITAALFVVWGSVGMLLDDIEEWTSPEATHEH